MKARKAYLKFMTAIQRAPDRAEFSVGLIWHPRIGWRVYQSIGETALAITAPEARKLADIYEKLANEPQWRGAYESMRENLGALRPLADEADKKNRDKAVPEGAAEFMPAEGSA